MGGAASSDSESSEMRPPPAWKSRIARFAPEDELLCQQVPASFTWALEDNLDIARDVLQNEHIALQRYRLVPSQLDENQFWRSFFYQLSLPAEEDEGSSSPVVVVTPPRPDSPPTTNVPMPPIDFDYFSPKTVSPDQKRVRERD